MLCSRSAVRQAIQEWVCGCISKEAITQRLWVGVRDTQATALRKVSEPRQPRHLARVTRLCWPNGRYHLSDGEPEESQFSFGVAVAFTINYIMGAGFLGVPQAFSASGLVLGSVLMILATLLCDITKNWVLEAMARAETMEKVALLGRQASGVPSAALRAASITRRASLEDGGRQPSGAGGSDHATALAATLLAGLSADEDTADGRASVNGHGRADGGHPTVPRSPPQLSAGLWEVTSRKFEVAEMFDIFAPPCWRFAWTVALWLYKAGQLWSFGAVFAASFSLNVPLPFLGGTATCNVENDSNCLSHYRFWLGVFAVFTVPLSCLELREQVALQVRAVHSTGLCVCVVDSSPWAGKPGDHGSWAVLGDCCAGHQCACRFRL